MEQPFCSTCFNAPANTSALCRVLICFEVVLIVTLATYFAEKIQKHKWIGYVGLVVILIVAIQLIIGGLSDYGVLSINEAFKRYF